MKIKDIEFKNNLILAPMANVTDVAFRSIAIEYGADAGVTELISAKAITYGNKKTFDMMHTANNEKIKILQLFGCEPEVFKKALKNKHVQKFDIIDINMGCPVPKVVKNGEGCALMLNLDVAKACIEACVLATSKPITVKFRSGFDHDHINAVEFAKMCEKAGASAVTIHARCREDYYSGKADWDVIKAVKQAVKIPVIGNGDVVDRESYLNMLNYTGCDAVMVGRATMGAPYIFSELLNKDVKISKFEIIKKHYDLLKSFYPEEFVVKHMRKHVLWYLKNVKNSAKIKVQVMEEKSFEKVLQLIKTVFESEK